MKVNGESRVQVRVRVPAGTPAAYIQSASDKPKQRETLVIPGQRMIVRDVIADNGRVIVHGRARWRGVESAACPP